MSRRTEYDLAFEAFTRQLQAELDQRQINLQQIAFATATSQTLLEAVMARRIAPDLATLVSLCEGAGLRLRFQIEPIPGAK